LSVLFDAAIVLLYILYCGTLVGLHRAGSLVWAPAHARLHPMLVISACDWNVHALCDVIVLPSINMSVYLPLFASQRAYQNDANGAAVLGAGSDVITEGRGQRI